MAEPCKQEGILGGLSATQTAIKDTLLDIKNGQEKFIKVLETIASQGTKIDKLEEDTETLYARVRKVELNAVEHGVKITAAAGFFSIIISAIATFLLKVWGK
jgi:preprotein translocase subunit YajC